jgi:hypothetical protein
MKFLFLRALSLFLASFAAYAADPLHCSPLETPLPQQTGEVCIYPGAKNADVLYYLHGKDAGAETWGLDDFWSQQIRDFWKEKGLAAPTVVSVSLGGVWLLAPKTTAPGGFGMLDLFVGRVLPGIEAKLGGVKGRRILLGDSMGGFNALQLGMKTRLFAKVAALCAPMADGAGPFSSAPELEAFIRSSTAFKSKRHTFEELLESFKTIQTVVGFFWGNDAEWKLSDPIQVARNLRGPLPVSFYLAAGYFDHYMTYEGNAVLAQQLKKSGTQVDWRPQWGDHCAVDIPSLASFLVK